MLIEIEGFKVSVFSAAADRERPVKSKMKLMNIESSSGGL